MLLLSLKNQTSGCFKHPSLRDYELIHSALNLQGYKATAYAIMNYLQFLIFLSSLLYTCDLYDRGHIC